MNYKLIILDFDGTLADTRAPIVQAKQETMKRLGLPVVDEELCASTIGLSAHLGFQQLYPDLPKEKIDQCVTLYRSLFEEIIARTPPPLFPGVKETLHSLKENGKILTVATSRHNSSLHAFLDALEVTPFFSYILGGDDTRRLKPYPDPVLKTLKDLRIPAGSAIVVGDMPFDVLMAKRSDVAACGVTYGNAAEEDLCAAGADYIIHSFEELLLIV
jgi:phosphoglycolate phosphatase-like HAD superfamily hydrolase